jgi:hypothetical protein
MSRFLNLHRPDPYRLFAAFSRRSALGLRAAYDAAFAADMRCKELMQEERWLSARAQPLGFPVFTGDIGDDEISPLELAERREVLWAEAEAEDLQTDLQASIVVLWADDTLRRFERGVLERKPRFARGYGPTYGENVPLTTLLRAATNTLRHVSDWDDDEDLVFPYDLTVVNDKDASNEVKQAYRNIAILQRAFGIGKHEPIREPVSWRVLVAVDGQRGTAPPDFARFEAAVLASAREIAAEAGGSELLEAALARVRVPQA